MFSVSTEDVHPSTYHYHLPAFQHHKLSQHRQSSCHLRQQSLLEGSGVKALGLSDSHRAEKMLSCICIIAFWGHGGSSSQVVCSPTDGSCSMGRPKPPQKPVPPVLRKSEAARRGVDASDRFHSELWSKRVISALQRAGNMI